MTGDGEQFAPVCGGCAHFHLNPPAVASAIGADPPALGACWRYPPTAIGLPMPLPPQSIAMPGAPPGAQGAALVTYALRPPVALDTPACGEFEVPENVAESGDAGLMEREIDPRGTA